MKRIYLIALCALLLIVSAPAGGAYTASDENGLPLGLPAAPAQVRKVKVYLVAVGDEGKLGRKIGCGDSLVPVTRSIKATGAPLKAALQELLSLPKEYAGDSRLNNFWVGDNLRVKSVSIRAATATIHITGTGPFIAGVCDQPRITSQIEATARQFPSVKRVKVFVNGRSLADAIR
jgi:hypothetical protein